MMKLSEMLSVIYPKRCAVCGEVIYPDSLLCENCEEKIASLRIGEGACSFCAAEKKYCSCGGRNSAYKGFTAPFYYENGIRKSISDFKFREQKGNSEFLGKEMARCVQKSFANAQFDIITAVPLSSKGLRERGYNQSELLAKRISKEIGVPYERTLIKKYDVPAQHTLKAAQRKANVAGVFDILQNNMQNVSGKRILLCDDIRTTGATLGECSRVLRDSGAVSVHCVCAAAVRRAIDKNESLK